MSVKEINECICGYAKSERKKLIEEIIKRWGTDRNFFIVSKKNLEKLKKEAGSDSETARKRKT